MAGETQFPLGAYVGNPDASDPAAEAAFQAQLQSLEKTLGAAPRFMDAFIEKSQPISSWVSNADWTAWSWASDPAARAMTPVIGLPMATNSDWNDPDAVFKAWASGQHDDVLRGVVAGWKAQGFNALWFRPGYEMNGPWFPWYASDNPQTQADWVAAFRRISYVLHAAGQSTGVDVKVAWSPNINTKNFVDVASLYPGDAFVDAIAPDYYSQLYPDTLYDWARNDGTYDASDWQWAANPVNRVHYWNNPVATPENPNSSDNCRFSLSDAIAFAKAHGKPFDMGETGAGPRDGTPDPTDESAFPQWLADTLKASGVPIAFVNIWDVNLGSNGDWDFTSAGANKPQEAAVWARNFGGGSAATAAAAAPPTAAAAVPATGDDTAAVTPATVSEAGAASSPFVSMTQDAATNPVLDATGSQSVSDLVRNFGAGRDLTVLGFQAGRSDYSWVYDPGGAILHVTGTGMGGTSDIQFAGLSIQDAARVTFDGGWRDGSSTLIIHGQG